MNSAIPTRSFLTRTIVALVAAPLLLFAVWVGFPLFHTLVALIAAIMAWEWEALSRGVHSFRGALIGFVAIGGVLVADFRPDLSVWLTAALFLALIGMETVARERRSSLFPLGALYVVLPAICLIFLLRQAGPLAVIWLLVVIWGTDIGGYVAGKLIGGPKLAPTISPNKTWAGFFGALVFALVGSAGVLMVSGAGAPLSLSGLAILMSLAAQGGDLLESRIKRHAGVKDSGTLLPGHGGLMDRFDGLWAAAPVFALLVIVRGANLQAW